VLNFEIVQRSRIKGTTKIYSVNQKLLPRLFTAIGLLSCCCSDVVSVELPVYELLPLKSPNCWLHDP